MQQGPPIDSSTVCQRLFRIGLTYRVAVNKPFLVKGRKGLRYAITKELEIMATGLME